jgi:anti-sigma factor RsiW
MTCREFIDFLMSYIDGELDAGVRQIFESHLDCCADCVRYMRGYESAIAMGRCACRDEDGPPPEDVPPELIAAILAARKAG